MEEWGVAPDGTMLTVMASERDHPKQDWLMLFGDNQGALALAHRELVNTLSKHITRKYHWIRENREGGGFTMAYVRTRDMLADIMTKPLPKEKFLDMCA